MMPPVRACSQKFSTWYIQFRTSVETCKILAVVCLSWNEDHPQSTSKNSQAMDVRSTITKNLRNQRKTYQGQTEKPKIHFRTKKNLLLWIIFNLDFIWFLEIATSTLSALASSSLTASKRQIHIMSPPYK